MLKIQRQLGKRVRVLRKKAGLTISELAEAANLSDNYVGFIERGVRVPTIKTLARLAKALKINIAEFFYFAEQGSVGKEYSLKKLLYQLKDKDIESIELISEIAKNVFTSSYGRKKKGKKR